MLVGLMIILILVLFLPFTVKTIEEHLEEFLFAMGIFAAIVSGVLDRPLILKALEDPIHITLAVLVAGIIFKWLQTPIENGIMRTQKAISMRLFLASIIVILGLISSIITAIIAAIILVIIASVLKLDRQSEIRFVILACFAIGLGASLTPIGEPLSTIAVSKLNEDFFFLIRLIGSKVIPAVIIFAMLAIILIKPKQQDKHTKQRNHRESYLEIITRSFKVYLFVMGLTMLGAGFEPLIKAYLLDLSPAFLYWLNMISAILDNATLAAAEISPAMDHESIKAILMGLLISGGMLIPGNIPNIIAAGKLQITSKEWASFGVPIGLLSMIVYFVFFLL